MEEGGRMGLHNEDKVVDINSGTAYNNNEG